MDEKHRKFNRYDVYVIFLSLLICGVFFMVIMNIQKKEADKVVIKVDGEVQGVYNLEEEQKIEINGGKNILQIKDKKAKMISGDCPDQICVQHKEIGKNRESIICLPNKIVVEIQGKDEGELDAITR
ncbi:hypothetical protein M2454_000497 [Aequitasia blattaphilus]|uniref:NusG domain II-containing protein n=1 Tax=Aequitasia blattaphilus TaxID=2949332 RepID=A0ABT1E5L8_9FIRM|nr:NusG domain II-containing protein [Aequitasia blattaphilus]MCP1101114.1 NusG domain II-containing protein [Aequitasia blattaphilus]MCR8613754.1 NusG domain II-containing protein [Aequitasia blattaphilus]